MKDEDRLAASVHYHVDVKPEHLVTRILGATVLDAESGFPRCTIHGVNRAYRDRVLISLDYNSACLHSFISVPVPRALFVTVECVGGGSDVWISWKPVIGIEERVDLLTSRLASKTLVEELAEMSDHSLARRIS